MKTELWNLYPYIAPGARAMLFVDGENLALRYKAMRRTDNEQVADTHGIKVRYREDVAVWADHLAPENRQLPHTTLLRKYYYTSMAGTNEAREEVADWLRQQGGFEAPRVFPKSSKTRGSKQVDISLCCDMLTHAARRHYDVAILVAGDGDYMPLVRAVKSEGARAHVGYRATDR